MAGLDHYLLWRDGLLAIMSTTYLALQQLLLEESEPSIQFSKSSVASSLVVRKSLLTTMLQESVDDDK